MTKLVKNRVLKHLNYLKSFGYEYHESLDFFSNNLKYKFLASKYNF